MPESAGKARIKQLRARLVRAVQSGAVQKQIASAAGIRPSSLATFKTGPTGLSPAAADRLEAALDYYERNEETAPPVTAADDAQVRQGLKLLLRHRFGGHVPLLARALGVTAEKVERAVEGDGVIGLDVLDKARRFIEQNPVPTQPAPLMKPAAVASARELRQRWGLEAVRFVLAKSTEQKPGGSTENKSGGTRGHE